MLARKQHKNNGTPFPEQWTQEITTLLNKIYAKECEQLGKSFTTWGRIYEDELVVISSLANNEQVTSVPMTSFLSIDVNPEKKLKIKDRINTLVDLIGLVFDTILADDDWNDYAPNWTKETAHNLDFFYKVSRENVSLTLDADEILAKADKN